jgi:hypothetical protein
MHSTASTCPQVGSRYYPPFLEKDKEMMSRGPHVAYMEYREVGYHAEPFIHYTSPSDRWHQHPPHLAWIIEENMSFSMR